MASSSPPLPSLLSKLSQLTRVIFLLNSHLSSSSPSSSPASHFLSLSSSLPPLETKFLSLEGEIDKRKKEWESEKSKITIDIGGVQQLLSSLSTTLTSSLSTLQTTFTTYHHEKDNEISTLRHSMKIYSQQIQQINEENQKLFSQMEEKLMENKNFYLDKIAAEKDKNAKLSEENIQNADKIQLLSNKKILDESEYNQLLVNLSAHQSKLSTLTTELSASQLHSHSLQLLVDSTRIEYSEILSQYNALRMKYDIQRHEMSNTSSENLILKDKIIDLEGRLSSELGLVADEREEREGREREREKNIREREGEIEKLRRELEEGRRLILDGEKREISYKLQCEEWRVKAEEWSRNVMEEKKQINILLEDKEKMKLTWREEKSTWERERNAMIFTISERENQIEKLGSENKIIKTDREKLLLSLCDWENKYLTTQNTLTDYTQTIATHLTTIDELSSSLRICQGELLEVNRKYDDKMAEEKGEKERMVEEINREKEIWRGKIEEMKGEMDNTKKKYDEREKIISKLEEEKTLLSDKILLLQSEITKNRQLVDDTNTLLTNIKSDYTTQLSLLSTQKSDLESLYHSYKHKSSERESSLQQQCDRLSLSLRSLHSEWERDKGRVREWIEKYRTLEGNYKGEMKKLKEEKVKEERRVEEEYKIKVEELNKMRVEMETEKDNKILLLSTQLSTQQSDHQLTISTLLSTHQSAITTLHHHHTLTINKMNDDFTHQRDIATAALRNDFHRELGTAVDSAKREVASEWIGKSDNIRKYYEEIMAELRDKIKGKEKIIKEKEEEKGEMEREMKEREDKLKEILEETKKMTIQYEDKIRQLTTDYESQLALLIKTHEDTLATLHLTHQQEKSALKLHEETLKTEYENIQSVLSSQILWWEHKYSHRESREEDVMLMLTAKERIRKLKDEKKEMREEMEYLKREMGNREENYNKTFGRKPVVAGTNHNNSSSGGSSHGHSHGNTNSGKLPMISSSSSGSSVSATHSLLSSPSSSSSSFPPYPTFPSPSPLYSPSNSSNSQSHSVSHKEKNSSETKEPYDHSRPPSSIGQVIHPSSSSSSASPSRSRSAAASAAMAFQSHLSQDVMGSSSTSRPQTSNSRPLDMSL